MKMLQSLKEEILNNKINKVYVFYGEDYGLRKHYINKLAENYTEVKVIDDAFKLGEVSSNNSLFEVPTLYIVYNDIEFAKANKTHIDTFLSKIGKDKLIIFDYEDLSETTTLFKEYPDLITNFSNVKDNIALEFVDSEVTLNQSSKEELAFNCNNNYNSILLETDKIKNYKLANNLSEQKSFEELSIRRTNEF